MATEIHSEGATNGNLKRGEVEPLGELKGAAEDALKPECKHAAAGDVVENGCVDLAEKEEPLAKVPTPSKLKEVVIQDDAEENADDPQEEQEFSSEEEADTERGDDARGVEGAAYEDDDDDEEYVDDGEDDEGEDEDASEPPPKRRK